MPKRFTRGFTLIELLVVISIIGVLAALTLASFGNAQQKARDGIRKSDLAQLKRALELAKSDCSGSSYYPYMGSTTTLTEARNAYNGASGLAPYLSNSTLNYISSIIEDPTNSTDYIYAYYNTSPASLVDVCPDFTGTFTTDGSDDYVLAVKLERETDQSAEKSRDKCTGKPGDNITNWDQAAYFVVCNN